MRRHYSKRVAIALAIVSVTALTGCGKGSSVTNVGGSVGGLVPGGCVPISSPISFTATGAMVDPYTKKIFAGAVPGYTTAGTVVVGAGGAVAGGQVQGRGVDGQIDMALNYGNMPTAQPYPTYPGTYPTYPGTYPGYPTPTSGYGASTVNITGTLQISPIQQQQIMLQWAQMYPYGGGAYPTGAYPTGAYPTYPGGAYPTYPGGAYPTMPQPGMPAYNQQVCVSGLAIGDGYVYPYQMPNFGGKIYLYLGNTQHGYILYFY